MSSKRKPRGKDVVFHLSAEEATLSKMPKYNAYAGGYGAHGTRKYDRNREKESFRRELKDS